MRAQLGGSNATGRGATSAPSSFTSNDSRNPKQKSAGALSTPIPASSTSLKECRGRAPFRGWHDAGGAD